MLKKISLKLFSLALLGIAIKTYAQQEQRIGLNTAEPKATVDIQISKENLLSQDNEGILIPKVTRRNLNQVAAENLEESTLVYVSEIDGQPIDRTALVKQQGFYIYMPAPKDRWVRIGCNCNSN